MGHWLVAHPRVARVPAERPVFIRGKSAPLLENVVLTTKEVGYKLSYPTDLVVYRGPA